MKTMVLITFISAMFFTACEKTENFELPEVNNLTAADNPVAGTWREIEPEGLGQFEGSTFTALDLREDYTFILSFKKWSDMLRVGDSCIGTQDYFAKGVYSLSDDSIIFEGCYSDSGHTACQATCDGQISFTDSYRYTFHNDSLVLNPDAHPQERRVLARR